LDSRESGFEFLGFSFRWQKSKKGTQYVHTEPSPVKALALISQHSKEAAERDDGLSGQ
jgi:hypothetical protein